MKCPILRLWECSLKLGTEGVAGFGVGSPGIKGDAWGNCKATRGCARFYVVGRRAADHPVAFFVRIRSGGRYYLLRVVI